MKGTDMFKKLAVVTAASALVLASTAAQAGSASALSLHNAPAARASTGAQQESKLLPGSPLFAILGIIGIVAVLEVTGAINIFGDDDPDSN